MRETHKFAKRVSSTYVFGDSELLQALGAQFKLKGWTDADWSRRSFEYDEDRHELTVVLHYDEPMPSVPTAEPK